MRAEITLPVHLRVGDYDGCFGDLTVGLEDGVVPLPGLRTQLAGFLRAAAEAIENPSQDDEEVPGAAADG
ncbi:hypothetical protein [Streptomyces sp. NPDC047028]|uniref:hypothetical protein n=1 Tax=Streptomyces sp. NPDC047028 TaxID=3155793 RepID=UPI0033C373CF